MFHVLLRSKDPITCEKQEYALFLCVEEKPSESGCGGSEGPVLESELPQIADENSCSSHFSISDCLRAPGEPDFADRSSQSSLNSQDDAGMCSRTHTHRRNSLHTIVSK